MRFDKEWFPVFPKALFKKTPVHGSFQFDFCALFLRYERKAAKKYI